MRIGSTFVLDLEKYQWPAEQWIQEARVWGGQCTELIDRRRRPEESVTGNMPPELLGGASHLTISNPDSHGCREGEISKYVRSRDVNLKCSTATSPVVPCSRPYC